MALPRKSPKKGQDESLPTEVRELVDLVILYAKQQTLGPIKELGRWVLYGLLGAVCVAIGFLFIALGLLRAIQTEAGHHLTGLWSWVPYFVVVVFLGVVIALLVRRISHGPGSKEP